MRWSVLMIILLAGCSATPPAPVDDVDPTKPIHGGLDMEALQLAGPQANGTGDASVAVGRCAATDNVMAYNIYVGNVSGGPETITLHLVESTAKPTLFLIATFDDAPGGLVAASLFRGGLAAAVGASQAFYAPDWLDEMPSSFAVPISSDGVARFLIACSGEGAVNYAVGQAGVSAPDYLEPLVETGFDAFLAIGSDDLIISIPPNPGARYVSWSTVGGAEFEYEQLAGSGARIGATRITWGADGGWATAQCSHQGWSDHGTWSYEADLGDGPVQATGFMASDVATLWLTQDLLFGAMEMSHTGEGEGPLSMAFVVEHVASVEVLWYTECNGAHVAATLDTLFGRAAQPSVSMPEGLV